MKPNVVYAGNRIGWSAALLAALLLSGCGHKKPPPPPPYTLMGTEAYASGYRTLLREKMARLESLLSLFGDKSEIRAINEVAGQSRLPVSKYTLHAVQYALQMNKLTDGAFDVTLAPLADLWGFHGGPQPDQPLPEAILRASLESVGSDKVDIEENTVYLSTPFTQLDLSDMLHGYAIDVCLVQLRQKGAKNLFIRIGHTARCLGRPHTINVPDPFNLDGTLGKLTLRNRQAVSSVLPKSHTVTIAGKTYGSILDPHTGKPAEGVAQATVLAPNAAKAQAVAVALVVDGIEGAAKLLKKFPRCEALIVPDRRPPELWMTAGFEEQFSAPEGWAAHRIERLKESPAPGTNTATQAKAPKDGDLYHPRKLSGVKDG